jgi:hypothetical protein
MERPWTGWKKVATNNTKDETPHHLPPCLVGGRSLLVVPGIDGGHDIPAVFDGVSPSKKKALPLRLPSSSGTDVKMTLSCGACMV